MNPSFAIRRMFRDRYASGEETLTSDSVVISSFPSWCHLDDREVLPTSHMAIALQEDICTWKPQDR